MRQLVKLLLVGCAVMVGACNVNSAPEVSTQAPTTTNLPATSKPMPPLNESSLNWRLPDGSFKKVADYKGKVVILDFWATYCPPCEEGIPHFVELSNKHKDNLQVVGLHVGGEEDRPKIADFVTKYRMKYDLGYPNQALMDFYLQGDTAIPQTFVLDRNGQLIAKFVGFTPEIKTEIDKAVQTALAVQ